MQGVPPVRLAPTGPYWGRDKCEPAGQDTAVLLPLQECSTCSQVSGPGEPGKGFVYPAKSPLGRLYWAGDVISGQTPLVRGVLGTALQTEPTCCTHGAWMQHEGNGPARPPWMKTRGPSHAFQPVQHPTDGQQPLGEASDLAAPTSCHVWMGQGLPVPKWPARQGGGKLPCSHTASAARCTAAASRSRSERQDPPPRSLGRPPPAPAPACAATAALAGTRQLRDFPNH